jgi:hypothetical protein
VTVASFLALVLGVTTGPPLPAARSRSAWSWVSSSWANSDSGGVPARSRVQRSSRRTAGQRVRPAAAAKTYQCPLSPRYFVHEWFDVEVHRVAGERGRLSGDRGRPGHWVGPGPRFVFRLDLDTSRVWIRRSRWSWVVR